MTAGRIYIGSGFTQSAAVRAGVAVLNGILALYWRLARPFLA
jgi:hypothetical protein